MEKYQVVIIGAGICGLTIGRHLANSNLSFKIIEKSKAFGGRAATRRISLQAVDHGAQYFTANDDAFLQCLDDLKKQGIVKIWTDELSAWDGVKLEYTQNPSPRFVCPFGITAIAKDWAQGLPVERECKITQAIKENGLWKLKTDSALELQAERVISTAPLSQSLEIFSSYLTENQKTELEKITYNPCLSLILTFDLKHKPDWKGIFWNTGEVLSWVANDSSKRDNPQQLVLVAQCKAEFSAQYFDESSEIVIEKVVTELREAFGDWILTPLEAQVKKWRYSQAAETFGEAFVQNEDASLILTGDWCLSSKIEGAYLAGKAVAEKLLR